MDGDGYVIQGSQDAPEYDGASTGSQDSCMSTRTEQRLLRLNKEETKVFDASAEAAGVSFAEWVRRRLNATLGKCPTCGHINKRQSKTKGE